MKTRAYTSPLREEQAAQTRRRLIDKLLELLADERVAEVSVADVAREAKVSVRTAYRYFPTREDLFDAVNAEAEPILFKRTIARPTDADDIPRFARELHASFAENETMIRAHSRSHTGTALRARRKDAQIRLMAQLLEPITPHLGPEERHATAVALIATISATSWLELRTTGGLTPLAASRAIVWIVETVLARLRKDADAYDRARRRT